MVRRLLLLNGLAAIGAVIHHSINWVLTAMFWWTDRYVVTTVPNYDQLGGAGFYTLRLIDQFVVVSVPAFLFVSGYFIAATAGHSDRAIGWRIVFARIASLLPPYILWSLFVVLMKSFNGESYSFSKVVWVLLTGGAAAPFYYVPLAIQLYLISPWLVSLARNRWQPLLIITALIQLLVAIMRSFALLDGSFLGVDPSVLTPLLNWHLAAYSFWFAFGLVVCFRAAQFKLVLSRIRRALPLGLALVCIVAFVEWELLRRLSEREWISSGVTFFDNFVSLALLLLFFSLETANPPGVANLNRIGGMSFGIYLIHIPVLEVLARATYHFAPGLMVYPIIFQLLLIVAGVGVPVLLMTVFRASPLRRYYAYAFGQS